MNDALKMVGNLSMLMYVIIVALSSMMIHQTNQQITPLLSAFYTFSFCLFVYNAASRGLVGKIALIKQHWPTIFALNMTTAISWIFAFFSLKFIPPELFLSVYLCAMPIVSSFLYKTQLIRACIFLAGLILLSSTYHVDKLEMGFLLAFLGGASGAIYSIYSKRATVVFSTLEILSLRFYLIVGITFMLSLHFNTIQIMNIDFYLKFLLLSFVSVISPLFLFQVGIKHLSVRKSLSYLPLAPLLCYFMNILFNHFAFNLLQMMAILFINIAMLIKTE